MESNFRLAIEPGSKYFLLVQPEDPLFLIGAEIFARDLLQSFCYFLSILAFVVVVTVCLPTIEFGIVRSGKNWPAILSPVGMAGTPSRGGASDADITPSRKTFRTTARRALLLRFSYEPCTISEWWNEHSPCFSSMGTGLKSRCCSGVRAPSIAFISFAKPARGKRFHL